MLKYSSALNSLTAARATYSMILTYEEVPANWRRGFWRSRS